MAARGLAGVPLAMLLAIAACRAAPEPPTPPADRPALGLMTTLPLLWAETDDIAELVRGAAAPGWVRATLEDRYALVPLDTLDAGSLAGIDRLILAQPRALGPAENVALDGWVRAGGRLLLFADPMLTRHSRFPIGDPRRPQDVALLSPILARWGLELRFDEGQAAGERIVTLAGTPVPVNLAGDLRLSPGASCAREADGVLVRCRIGAGSIVVVADAAMLDDGDPDTRAAALVRLMQLALP